MFRVLISRRWLGALAVALAFAAAAFFLGRWQWGRYEDKSARANQINSHYYATPRPVQDVLKTGPLPPSAEWTRVSMHGRYAVQSTMVVRNRPHQGAYGYEVVVPFADTSGRTVLVDRGWVLNAQNAATLPSFPAAPGGEVTVTGWLRPTEPSLGRVMPAGQLASINLTEASRAVGTPLGGGYVILQSERLADGSSPPRPVSLDPPDTDLGPHQAYAFQWWLGMVGGVVLVFFGARREYQESLTGSEDHRGTATARPPKPVKVRIWDEEDA
ncbi:MAG TPA: SURF1 family protein [Pedococcus sp.]|nr:SURF1 family protein [Pedococcus sp.]